MECPLGAVYVPNIFQNYILDALRVGIMDVELYSYRG